MAGCKKQGRTKKRPSQVRYTMSKRWSINATKRKEKEEKKRAKKAQRKTTPKGTARRLRRAKKGAKANNSS